MVIVSARSAYTLLDYVAKYETVMVRITSNGKSHSEKRIFVTCVNLTDPNPWGDMLESGAMVTYSVILPIVIGSCLIFAVFKQVMWIRRRGFQKSIPQTVLWFEIVANISTIYIWAIYDSNIDLQFGYWERQWIRFNRVRSIRSSCRRCCSP